MPFRLFGRRLYESLRRFLLLAALVGIGWLVLQFYSVDELENYARVFWNWWAGLVEGRYAQYWNPFGAALVLFLIVTFLLGPLMPRRRGARSYHHGGDDGGGDGGNGGD